MNLILIAATTVLVAILLAILCTWIYFLWYMRKSFSQSPRLEPNGLANQSSFTSPSKLTEPIHEGRSIPKVSVILPARNEEQYIARCLDTLLDQDYSNFEIIAINDSSTDKTGEIIRRYAAKDRRVVYVEAGAKPDGWAGKTWACYQGYLKASGDLLLFTDADTEHSIRSMSMAVEQMRTLRLDALTAVPRLLCSDFWTNITLPQLATFLHTRFSPLRVNDPKTKTGYFFGSFFLITRHVYESVGTHMGVRQELVEDGALGGRVKSAKFNMKMFRGEKQITAVWARDLGTLWHGLRRLMIPLYHQSKTGALLSAMATFFLLFEPFLVLVYSVWLYASIGGLVPDIMLATNLATVALIFLTTAFQCKRGLFENPLYALGSPLGGALIAFGFFVAIASAKRKDAVRWRDRTYTISEGQHPIH
jgi:cellulose synthase/poly-beta-1,6-N-acetylglucosamine synthase-like glycosyltransferase